MEVRLLAARRIGELVPAEDFSQAGKKGGRGKKASEERKAFVVSPQRLSEFRKLAAPEKYYHKKPLFGLANPLGLLSQRTIWCTRARERETAADWFEIRTQCAFEPVLKCEIISHLDSGWPTRVRVKTGLPGRPWWLPGRPRRSWRQRRQRCGLWERPKRPGSRDRGLGRSIMPSTARSRRIEAPPRRDGHFRAHHVAQGGT